MKITRIKEINWWDPKVKQDAVTYKVFLDNKGTIELKWFDNKQDLDAFVKNNKPKKLK
jgi:hypothetical protein